MLTFKEFVLNESSDDSVVMIGKNYVNVKVNDQKYLNSFNIKTPDLSIRHQISMEKDIRNIQEKYSEKFKDVQDSYLKIIKSLEQLMIAEINKISLEEVDESMMNKATKAMKNED
jgi:hypothetical protein